MGVVLSPAARPSRRPPFLLHPRDTKGKERHEVPKCAVHFLLGCQWTILLQNILFWGRRSSEQQRFARTPGGRPRAGGKSRLFILKLMLGFGDIMHQTPFKATVSFSLREHPTLALLLPAAPAFSLFLSLSRAKPSLHDSGRPGRALRDIPIRRESRRASDRSHFIAPGWRKLRCRVDGVVTPLTNHHRRLSVASLRRPTPASGKVSRRTSRSERSRPQWQNSNNSNHRPAQPSTSLALPSQAPLYQIATDTSSSQAATASLSQPTTPRRLFCCRCCSNRI